MGIEVTAKEPQEEESARVCQDSERTGHVQAERIDLALHIWSRVQQELKRKIQLMRSERPDGSSDFHRSSRRVTLGLINYYYKRLHYIVRVLYYL